MEGETEEGSGITVAEEKVESPKKKKLGQEIGKAAAEKSRGLFSEDDWQCNKCGNVNWARRDQCNMCNAPKYGEVEERTGYGGGYNDRGVVEYIERVESDDEYDEFGRKKKKFRSNLRRDSEVEEEKPERKEVVAQVEEKPKVVEVKKVVEVDEEEEDDDDDDEVDLSKYDLTGWGDDEAEVITDKKNDEKDSREKSRPRNTLLRLHSSSNTRSRSRSGSRSASRDRRSSSSESRSTSSKSRSRSASSSATSSSSSRAGLTSASKTGKRERVRSRSPL